MVKPFGQTTPETEADTKARILAAAHEVFLEHGTARATTQAIADRAGVNKALIHYYFRTKQTLAREVFFAAHGQLWPQVFATLADPQLPLADKIRQVVAVQLAFVRRRPYLPGYVISELHAEPDLLAEAIGRRGRPPLEVVQAQIDAGVRAGTMRPMRAEQLITTLISAMLFPFAIRPALEAMQVFGEGGFEAYLDERERALPDLLIAGMQP